VNNHKFLSNSESFYLYSNLLDNVPLPIFCVNLKGDVIYMNQDYTSRLLSIHNMIESLITNMELEMQDKDGYSIVLVEESEESHVFNILKDSYNFSITRRLIKLKQNDCIMYIHQDIIKGKREDNKLQKMLKANELIIEIRDLVDNANDLNEMFEYLLSKIHTVIPTAYRSCILKIDENKNLIQVSKFNYLEEYKLDIPFKNSFACLNLDGDYSKSVIVDDIQKKYKNLFTDLQRESNGIILESNITTPLVVEGVFYGIVSVDSNENRVFDSVDLYFLDYLKVQIERAIEKYNRYQTIKRNSDLDPMTGISNRRNLTNLFGELVNKSQIENTSFLFVVFDIDNLKSINDNFGHLNGDKIIKQFAFVIQRQIRGSDFLARIGGDEFVGVFLNIDDDVLINRISDWKNHFRTNTIKFKKEEFATEFSYGISRFPTEGETYEELLKLADKRMYIQKQEKKTL